MFSNEKINVISCSENLPYAVAAVNARDDLLLKNDF